MMNLIIDGANATFHIFILIAHTEFLIARPTQRAHTIEFLTTHALCAAL